MHTVGQCLAGCSALVAVAGLLFAQLELGRNELRALRTEFHRQPEGYRAAWAGLRPSRRRAALLTLAGLTLLRLMLSLPAITPPYDDGASYSLFVSRGLLAVGAYYPLPNNHVLENLLAWLFFQASAGFWWSIRLPVLLGATAATVLWYAGWLREKYSARAALLATLLASLSQLGLYHAATGRGYWLVAGGAALVFFATLTLSRDSNRPRRAWLALVLGGIGGMWAVPTFALVLGSAMSWLGWQWLRKGNWRALGALAAAVGLLCLGSWLAYAPLLLVSGLDKLAGNGFVAPRPLGEILRGLPSYWWETEGFLAGQMRLGASLVLMAAIATVLLLRSSSRSLLPTGLALPWLRTGWPALWFMAAPYLIMLVLRVLAPGRTLFYKAFFLYALLALLVEWLLRQSPVRRRGWLRPILVLVGGLWLGYQLWCHARDNSAPLRNNAAFRAAASWLSRQLPGAALVPEPTHKIYLSLYLRSEHPAWPWQPEAQPRPGAIYRYVVCFPNQRGYFQPRLPFAPAFHNSEVDIYRLDTDSPSTPRPEQYWFLAK
ncbi:MAG: hypothetical protein M3Y54_15425 [Bacteroidota bacterium]|nr:hypothetical protein [Bacteroidota bacterium]